VVAGLLVATHPRIDRAAQGVVAQFAIEIDVIDPPASARLPAGAAVIPPAPVAAFGLEQAEAILEAIGQRLSQGLPFRLAGHDPSGPARRVVDVAVLQGNVEVAHHHQGLPLGLLGSEVTLQASKPLKLVVVFL
jgi:hypothetical protein